MHLLDGLIPWIAMALEIVGIAIIVGGFLWAGSRSIVFLVRNDPRDAFFEMRAHFGRGVLLGLEVLVAADIVRTVALDLNLESVLALGGLVIIRTFLSWSLTVEIEGRWPWQSQRSGDQETGAL